MADLDKLGTGDDNRWSPVRAEAAGCCHIPLRRVSPMGRVYRRSSANSTDGKEFIPQCRILIIGSTPERRARERRNRSHAAHFGTEVVGFEIDGYPVRLQHRLQRVGDLLAD